MNVGEMQRKLSLWAEQRRANSEDGLFASREDLRAHDLYHLLSDRDWLRLAYDHVAQNSGSKTAGCDGINMAYFEQDLEGNLQKLAEELKAQTFRPHPVRRVFIPKKDGKLRPLGIPSIRDRIVQEALRMVLEPIFEAEFYRYSYGFRPNRSTMDALGMIASSGTPQKRFHWVIEGDIKSYFDTINHELLMKLLRRRIRDQKLLTLIWRYLRAGVMEGKLFKPTEQGAPQGGILSPLLANVYLHELDLFLARYVDMDRPSKRRRRDRGSGNFMYVRYADDFVVLCNGKRVDAEAMRTKIHAFLADELKLTLSLEKTKITHIDDGFKFLGYEVKRDLTGIGQKLVKFLIPRDAQKKLRSTVQRITTYSASEHSVNAKILALNLHLRGWANYYRRATNASKVFSKLDDFVFWQTAHWLGRKFQCSMPNVMRRFYRRVDGALTLATDEFAVLRMASIKFQPMRARSFTNPYTTFQPLLDREEQFGVEHIWTGDETRPGMADLRPLVLERDQWRCVYCKRPVNHDSVRIDHLRPVSRFKRPVDANTLDNLQTLCIECHNAKTELDRRMESRMR